MAKGIVYVMSCTQGLLKIGKTAASQFENRMTMLESNGYRNFNGLKREFAVEVADYDEKEHLIHRLFDKSQVKIGDKGIEMFAVDLSLVIELLKAFDGKQIFPQAEDAPAPVQNSEMLPPDGLYYLSTSKKGFGPIKGTMKITHNQCIVLKGSTFAPWTGPENELAVRTTAKVENNQLVEDVVCASVSLAAAVCTGNHRNGWLSWKDHAGNVINIYRSQHGDQG
ncbi:GIY-YIG nuclease family protein [Mitsuokella jalaludinii]|uniref:GIY-YIG nuclease family protein n=1 Tax=Mitsuokella jalaludinii TaxID=187979 RepID=UPI00055C6799|nr:GIY-YIG nuclease family protein [Mitsuokella jalaludinii]